MRRIIREGGSVLHEGKVIDRLEHLPSEAETAAGDEAKLTAALQRIDDETNVLKEKRQQLLAEFRKLRPGKSKPTETDPPKPSEGSETPPA